MSYLIAIKTTASNIQMFELKDEKARLKFIEELPKNVVYFTNINHENKA